MRALWVPKAGVEEHEWEDGFAYDEATQRASIADGASSATASGTWARMLTSGFVTAPFATGDRASFGNWLGSRQGEWVPPESAGSDDWWNDAVAERGSWATLAVIAIDDSPTGWTVETGTVGDTCIVHVRDGERLHLVPDMEPDDFDSFPELVGTDPKSVVRTVGAYVPETFEARDGDLVLAMTDALAEWALLHDRSQDDVWDTLASVDQASLAMLVHDERHADRMVNDDVTLFRCQLGAV